MDEQIDRIATVHVYTKHYNEKHKVFALNYALTSIEKFILICCVIDN